MNDSEIIELFIINALENSSCKFYQDGNVNIINKCLTYDDSVIFYKTVSDFLNKLTYKLYTNFLQCINIELNSIILTYIDDKGNFYIVKFGHGNIDQSDKLNQLFTSILSLFEKYNSNTDKDFISNLNKLMNQDYCYNGNMIEYEDKKIDHTYYFKNGNYGNLGGIANVTVVERDIQYFLNIFKKELLHESLCSIKVSILYNNMILKYTNGRTISFEFIDSTAKMQKLLKDIHDSFQKHKGNKFTDDVKYYIDSYF